MKQLLSLLTAKLGSAKLGLGVLALLSGGTALALLPKSPELVGGKPATVIAPTLTADDQGVKLSVKPSQNKVVQHALDELFLDVEIEVPQLATVAATRKPTDLVLVLDRSGSMAEGNKLDFAKAAMRSFASRLSDVDRIALVSFDGGAAVEFPLATATADARRRLIATIDQVGLGGGTNISDGLDRGRDSLPASEPGRSARVILLSDGHANAGVTTPEGLTAIVKGIVGRGAVVSTIGMGLDFNEEILARLSDHGMGNYTYLATLEGLDRALDRDLGDAREQFASVSHLMLDVGDGVTVKDAAGYPLERAADGRVRVPLGQLLQGTMRNLTISVAAPLGKLGIQKLAGIDMSYVREGKERVIHAERPVEITVVPVEKSADAVASIDGAVLRKSWVENNAGRAKKEYSEHMRNGRREEAKKALGTYRNKLVEVAAATGVNVKDAALEAEISQLEAQADDAGVGTAGEMDAKLKAYSKASWSDAQKSQRVTKKK